MDFFDLPERTLVGRVVPKNSFDSYTNTKQKKLFTDLVARITWRNKLSPDTINLPGHQIKELQIFHIELKKREEIPTVLTIIDKAIPYHIVSWIQYQDEAYLSISSKHPNPLNENTAVIDWTFTTEWQPVNEVAIKCHLKQNLDVVLKDLILQVSGRPAYSGLSLVEIVARQQEIYRLSKEIKRLKAKIKASKQFNQKVALNLELQDRERELGEVEGL